MGFGGISIWQLLIILAIVVLVFGTKRLPGAARDIGSAITSFRDGMKRDNTDQLEKDKTDSKDCLKERHSMLDIGFAELVVVAAIALFVVGPERLPSTIRSLSLWLGRLKRSFEEIKSDVSRELHNEEVMRALAEGKDQIKDVTDVGTVIETEATRVLTEEPENPKSSERE